MSVTLTAEEVKELKKRLIEVRDRIGPYKMDNHEHAVSVMNHSSDHAVWALNCLEAHESKNDFETQSPTITHFKGEIPPCPVIPKPVKIEEKLEEAEA